MSRTIRNRPYYALYCRISTEISYESNTRDSHRSTSLVYDTSGNRDFYGKLSRKFFKKMRARKLRRLGKKLSDGQ